MGLHQEAIRSSLGLGQGSEVIGAYTFKCAIGARNKAEMQLPAPGKEAHVLPAKCLQRPLLTKLNIVLFVKEKCLKGLYGASGAAP